MKNILDSFGVRLSPDDLRRTKIFFRTMECVDRHMDDVLGEEQRALGKKISECLHGDGSKSGLPDELSRHLQTLKDKLATNDASAEFIKGVEEIFTLQQLIAHVAEEGTYVALRATEGEWTARLLLLFINQTRTASQEIIVRMARAGNLIDSICDVYADHRRGEVRVRPTPSLYLRTCTKLMKEVTGLLSLHPNILVACGLGISFCAKLVRSLLMSSKRSAMPTRI